LNGRNKSSMRLSVIMPTYNREHLVDASISSILAQTRQPDEIVVCDDGSTDCTAEKVIKCLENQKIAYKLIRIENSGPSFARKSAIENTSGDWFFFLDSDDTWQPDYLEVCERVVMESGADVIVANFRKILKTSVESVEILDSKFSQAPDGFWEHGFENNREYLLSGGPTLFEKTLSFQPSFPSGLGCSRVAYERSGGITIKSRELKAEDAHLARKLFFFNSVAFLKDPKVEILIHKNNFSAHGDGDITELLKGRLFILQDLSKNPHIKRRCEYSLSQEIKKSIKELFNHYCWAGRNREAVKFFEAQDKKIFSKKDKVKYIFLNAKIMKERFL
jgi:glycosyltransferase involved in cell wall biosynthesis